MTKINSQYQKMIEQIKIDADKFADQQMRNVYKNQKDHLTELHKYLGLLFVTYAADGLLKVTPFQKNNIMADLKTKLTGMAKDMSSTEINQVMDILEKNYTDTYYKNAYVMDSGVNVNLKFDILKKEYIDAAVNNPVDGELFSDRIWSNKVAVADKVRQGIVDAMEGDTTIDKLGKDIQTTFNIGAYESQRLVNTENARVQCQAIDDIGESAGCSQQMYCATLEENTCSECAEYDGQYFDIDDDSKPDIPLHPNCRCLYINVPPTGWEPSARKDNESKDIIDYEDYNSWLNNKYNNKDIEELNKIKDFKEPLAKRHNLNSITGKSIAKDKNTIIMPGVDVKKDIEDIKKGLYNKVNDTYIVNGRTYGYHNSRFYPIEGNGFISIDRGQYKALQYLIKNGNNDRGMTIFKNMGIPKDKIDEVIKIWEARNK